MKKIFFIFALTSFVGFSQNLPISTDNETLSGDPMLILTENGTIEGSKYMLDNWSEGYVILSDSILSHQNNMHFDQMEGALILKSQGKGAFKVKDNNVTGFLIQGKREYSKHYFAKINRSSFKTPPSTTKYYEVVNNLTKTNFLIKDVQKYVFDPNRSKGVGANNNFPSVYKEKTVYFLKNKDGKYVKTKLNKKAVLKNLSDKSSELKHFILSNKINFKNEHDVVKLLNHYHSL